MGQWVVFLLIIFVLPKFSIMNMYLLYFKILFSNNNNYHLSSVYDIAGTLLNPLCSIQPYNI